jgi:hypothetical protein
MYDRAVAFGRNEAPAFPMRSIRSSSSRVERPSRSSLVTITTSTGLERGHEFRQLRPVGANARHFLAIDRAATRRLQRLKLPGKVLVLRADPRVADNRHSPLLFRNQRYANHKSLILLVQFC